MAHRNPRYIALDMRLDSIPCCSEFATGFWKWSRHPNYFFEILVWWGMFVLATQTMSGVQLVAVASPLLVTSLLLFISGIMHSVAPADA